jgi:hypothetical protein
MSYTISPSKRAAALKKYQSLEFKAVVLANRQMTCDRLFATKTPMPFPTLEIQQREGLQIIRENCDELNRAWRVKRGVFRSGLILASVATYDDGLWYHVSFSLKDKIPSYEQTLFVRGSIFPASAKVIQVFPPVDEHYNFHPNCLHLWSCLEGDRLPDFRSMGMV